MEIISDRFKIMLPTGYHYSKEIYYTYHTKRTELCFGVASMEKSIGVTKARDMFRTIVDEVQYHGDKYVISRHGKPAVAIVPLQIYEKWKQERKEFFDLIREVQSANPDADPDEVMRDVLEAQQAIRAELRNID
jgi:prevent-host-death family protein